MPAEQAQRLLERATRLLEDVQNAPNDAPAARTARRAHELRADCGRAAHLDRSTSP